MIDIFKLFRVERKEDIYTYCLKAMLDSGNEVFKRLVGAHFGFNEEFQTYRGSFSVYFENREKITPDLILYNDQHIALIESKMFSF